MWFWKLIIQQKFLLGWRQSHFAFFARWLQSFEVVLLHCKLQTVCGIWQLTFHTLFSKKEVSSFVVYYYCFALIWNGDFRWSFSSNFTLLQCSASSEKVVWCLWWKIINRTPVLELVCSFSFWIFSPQRYTTLWTPN